MNARRLDVAVFGIVNAGKSSLINALVGRPERPASPIGGTTAEVASLPWRAVVADAADPGGDGGATYQVRLVDTPGIEEVAGEGRAGLAFEAAREADLVLFVVAEDWTAAARGALADLRAAGKPILVVLNKVDLLDPDDRAAVAGSIRLGVGDWAEVIEAASAPIARRRVEGPDGRARVEVARAEPEIGALVDRLGAALRESAADLATLNDLAGRAEAHARRVEAERVALRARAIRAADGSAAAVAVALAINPVPLLDFLAGPGGLAVLAIRVSEVYGRPLSPDAARGLAGDLIRGGRASFWGSLGATVAGGAMKILPGIGHLAGALTQGVSAGYFATVVGRALVDYHERGRDWGDGGLAAALARAAATTDRRALTRGLVEQIRARLGSRR